MNEPRQRPSSIEARSKRGATRIGDWVLHPDLGLLRGEAGEVRLNPKTLHVLLVMLDAGDRGVSRELLLEQVWGGSYPSDYVVSRAIADLRSAFGERAGEQKYIRTLPKYGYQLVAAQHELHKDTAALRDEGPRPKHSRTWYYVVAAGLVAVAAVLLFPDRQPTVPIDTAIVNLPAYRPLTSAPGLEHQPRIVPDGEWVVYAVLRPDRNDWDLFRVAASDGTPQPVAVTAGVHEHGPAVSPVGDQVAYVRLSEDGCDVVIQSITLGVPESIAACTARFATLVDWSPTGDLIAYTTREEDDPDNLRRLYLVDHFSDATSVLTDAVSPTGTDFYPRFSPSGRQVAFLRGEPQPDHRTTLWRVDVETGAEQALTTVPAQLGGMAWIDESTLIYSFSDAGRMYGRWIDLQTGSQYPLEFDELIHPDYSADSGMLVAARMRSDRNLAILHGAGQVTPLAESTSDDHHGQLSPDEAFVALISRRSGFDELWIVPTRGDVARRLTRFDGATVRYPDWRPDGQEILFTVQSDGAEQLFVVDILSGAVGPVTNPFRGITTPRWMPDGDRWVAGCLDGSGWGICVAGDDVERVADNLFRPQPVDGEHVAVVDSAGVLYRLSLRDGSVQKIRGGIPGNGRYGWTLEGERLLFLAGGDSGNSGRLLELDIDSGQLTELYSGLMPLADTNISVGRASGDIVFTRYQSSSDDLVLFEHVEFE